jgi:hypothetical protein
VDWNPVQDVSPTAIKTAVPVCGFGGFATRPTQQDRPPRRGGKMFAVQAKPNPETRQTRHKGLSSSPDFHELIGLFRVLHRGQQLLCLTMNAIHELLIGIGNPVTLQDRFSQPA